MKYLTQFLITSFILCLFPFSISAQYDVKDGMIKHHDSFVPSVLVNVNYDNLPRLQYAWENYLNKSLNIRPDGLVVLKDSDTMFDLDDGVSITNFTEQPVDFYTDFVKMDTAIQMRVYAELGDGYYVSPYEHKQAYEKMKAFTSEFIGDFAYHQKKQRMTELQLRIDYLQQEMLKYQSQNVSWLENLETLEARMADDKAKKEELETLLKTHAKQMRQVEKALRYEVKQLKRLLDKKDKIPSSVSVPKEF